jgi:hypothetical protein
MACPYFDPVRPRTIAIGAPGAMLPLGNHWVGLCRATTGQVWEPDQASLATLCNLGYARDSCPRFPADEGDRGPDAVRFTISRDDGRSVEVCYVVERDHHPFAHGGLEFSRAVATFIAPPPAETLHHQALAYITSYLRRKAEAAGS